MTRLHITILTFLLTLILGVLIIHPKYQELGLLEEKTKIRKAELQSKEEYLTSLQATSEELKKYQNELSIVNSALPSDPDLPALFDFLQKTASQNGLIFKEMKPPSVNTTKEPKEILLTLQMTGSYSSLKTFLASLGKSARIIEVESVSFTVPEKTALLTFDITIKVYSY